MAGGRTQRRSGEGGWGCTGADGGQGGDWRAVVADAPAWARLPWAACASCGSGWGSGWRRAETGGGPHVVPHL